MTFKKTYFKFIQIMDDNKNVYVFNNLYNDVNDDSLAGMFFAGLYGDTINKPPISILFSNSTIKIVDRNLPSSKSFSMEIPYIDCVPYDRYNLEEKLDNISLSCIGVCEYTIIGTRYDSDGKVFSTMISGFNNFDTIKGFFAYFISSNIYPVEMVVYRKEKSHNLSSPPFTNLKTVDFVMPIHFDDAKNTRLINHWVSPPKILIKYDDKMYVFISPNKKGWLLEGLKNDIMETLKITPKICIYIPGDTPYYDLKIK